jgi:putative Holliday junction resolvase
MTTGVILAFDYGERRIGVAAGGGKFGKPTRQRVLKNSLGVNVDIKNLIAEYKPRLLVVGLPHNLDGEETNQSAKCREFASSLEEYKIPVVLYDETLSSERARDRLGTHSHKAQREDIDSMAAQIILEDYIAYAAK